MKVSGHGTGMTLTTVGDIKLTKCKGTFHLWSSSQKLPSDASNFRPSSASNSTSRQTSHWDLLQAQLGYTRVQPNGQDHNGTIPATFDTPCDGAASDAFVGRGYDNLARYVAVASSGQ